MNKSLAAIAAAALAAVALPAPAPAQHAATGIQRCEAPDGTTIYTDKACAAFGATAAPMRGELVNRLVASAPGLDDLSRDRPSPITTVARRSPASGCARSPTQLAMDLQGAWALGDVNRIAESYHWAGMGQQQGGAVMDRLGRLSEATLWETHFFDAGIGPGGMQLASASGATDGAVGIMQLVFDDGAGTRLQDMRVRRYHGCYFVQF